MGRLHLAGCPLGEGLLRLRRHDRTVADPARAASTRSSSTGSPGRTTPRRPSQLEARMDRTQRQISEEQVMTNAAEPPSPSSAPEARWDSASRTTSPRATTGCSTCENSPHGPELITGLGRELTDTDDAVAQSRRRHPRRARRRSRQGRRPAWCPQMKTGAILLTLDPAAAYAGLLYRRDDIAYACAHPCHPSVFLERRPPRSAPTRSAASPRRRRSSPRSRTATRRGARARRGRRCGPATRPVLDVHWVTVKQLAVLEPTLVETVACMVGGSAQGGPARDRPHDGRSRSGGAQQSFSATPRWRWPTRCAARTRSPMRA